MIFFIWFQIFTGIFLWRWSVQRNKLIFCLELACRTGVIFWVFEPMDVKAWWAQSARGAFLFLHATCASLSPHAGLAFSSVCLNDAKNSACCADSPRAKYLCIFFEQNWDREMYFPLKVFANTSARQERIESRSITKFSVGWAGWHQCRTLVQYVNSFHPYETHPAYTQFNKTHYLPGVPPS